MARVFISYASGDSDFARQLAHHLGALGHQVWFDRWQIAVGENLIDRIGQGVEQAQCVVVVLSQQAAHSPWVHEEWQIKYYEELARGTRAILPVLIDDCVVPPFLRPRRFADFRSDYALGFANVALALAAYNPSPLAAPTVAHEAWPAQPTRTTGTRQNITLCYTNGMVKTPPRFVEVNVELGIPYLGKITGTWKPDEEEQRAAWELYIELVTRVTMTGLQPDEGVLRESLTSLYNVFTITRGILHKHGPSIARPCPGSDLSFGHLAINILNLVLRPLLSKWHPLLQAYEHTQPTHLSAFEHEQAWQRAPELRQALHDARTVLADYMTILADVADIPHYRDLPHDTSVGS